MTNLLPNYEEKKKHKTDLDAWKQVWPSQTIWQDQDFSLKGLDLSLENPIIR